MTCENTYTLPCGLDCGEWCLPVNGTYNGVATIEWEYESVTYRKPIDIKITESICFLWPFQTYGVFVFKVLDYDLNPLDIEIDGQVYDCFRAVGIPEYEIPEEEREELELLCPRDTDGITFEGSGTISITKWEIDNPPPGDDDWEFPVEIGGRGTVECDFFVFDEGDQQVEGEIDGKGTIELAHVVMGEPPGFKYLLHGEDLVMWAFGVRKLLQSYSGFCCRVQRHSDGAVKDIGFNAGWRDDVEINKFLKNTTGGIVRWYNQSGAGGHLNNGLMATQFIAGDTGGAFKKVINVTPFPAFGGDSGKIMGTANAGAWNGTNHTVHMVVSYVTNNAESLRTGSGYLGFVSGFASPHHSSVGTPEYYYNDVFQSNDFSNFLQAAIQGTPTHLWYEGADLSGFASCEFFENWNDAIFEVVVFNENKAAERTLKTNNTMPVYGL